MKLENAHLKAICASALLKPSLLEEVDDPSLLSRDPASLSEEEREDLREVALGVWLNESPGVDERTMYGGDEEEYLVGVYGVAGAYFVHAQEYDPMGPFATVERAVSEMESEYGEFMEPPEDAFDDEDDEFEEEDEYK
jgi:hypothetical protein